MIEAKEGNHEALSLSLSLLICGSSYAQQTENIASLSPKANQRFSSAVALGPLDSPNFDFAVIGVPRSDGSLLPESGEVHVYPATGIPPLSTFRIIPPTPADRQAYAHFGWSVAIGFVDSDPYADVVVGAPDLDVGGVVDQGRVYIFYGPWNGNLNPPYSFYTVLNVNTAFTNSQRDRFGFSVAVGHLDNDPSGFQDVVVGAPVAPDLSTSPQSLEAGAIDVFPNPAPSSTYASQIHIQQDPALRAAYNHFGWSVDIGRFI